ncbi:MAG: hypothetical protein WCN92_05320, partial [Eubacteriales bacterium]
FFRFISDIDRFYEEITDFLSTFNMSEDILKQLIIYQKNIICTPDNKGFVLSQNYDFYNYILHSMNNDYRPLHKIDNNLKVSPNGRFTDLTEYAREVVWYGRRLGKTVYTSNPECVSIDYY